MKTIIYLLFFTLMTFKAESMCPVYSSNGALSFRQNDAHYLILSTLPDCPEDVISYKKILTSVRLAALPTLVANRGRNNPQLGSFSFFEQVVGQLSSGSQVMPVTEGEFFFGHFTEKEKQEIGLAQEKKKGQLLIELIAWDYHKKLYNFYELIGQGGSAKWFYRGDSKDILSDNQFLYRSTASQFGHTLRCSACHTSGGPIMKELQPPHNDWWTKSRPLVFGNALPSADVKNQMQNLQDASVLSHAVQTGNLKLQSSPSYQQIKSAQSLQEQLRPLFCETEINLESSFVLSEQNPSHFNLSSTAFLNPFFGKTNLNFSKGQYNAYLSKYGLQFPENHLSDSDHVYLTPVKGYSDQLALQMLLNKGLLDAEFMYDVLAVDGQKSIFSQDRCSLLKLLPNSPSANWKAQFLLNLQKSSLNSAKILASHLTDPGKNKTWHLKMAQNYLIHLQSQGLTEDLFVKLLKDRDAVLGSEISKNPLGQILEPGFSVIFPAHRTW